MAAGGYKEFVAGETLDQDEINDYLMQGMLVFAGTAARGSAIGTPVEGQFTYLKDSDKVEFYDSTQWVELSTTPGAAVVSGTTGSPTLGTVTTGGTTYNFYEFTGDGSLTISEAGFADVLVVGGGGSSGSRNGSGGGGAGGVFYGNIYLPATTHTVTIGAGGALPTNTPGATLGNPGFNGTGSRLGIFAAAPGGGSGADCATNQDSGKTGRSGGSGGGGGSSVAVTGTGGAGLPGQGFDAGDGVSDASTYRSGGGGGGATQAGADAVTTTGGDGGDGFDGSFMKGASAGTNYYGGGGGGGAFGNTHTPGAGGLGGGGDGENGVVGSGGTAGQNGSANTGGGAGGAGSTTPYQGGSGIVIVRVAV